ncbi:MAG: hypothetical protein GX206_05530 [Clostridiales bacterium]|nr:hypothetical protein [Clostridiales bacterium]
MNIPATGNQPNTSVTIPSIDTDLIPDNDIIPGTDSQPIERKTYCSVCHGSKVCSICHGTGQFSMYGNDLSPCTACGGTGICYSCNGTGYN